MNSNYQLLSFSSRDALLDGLLSSYVARMEQRIAHEGRVLLALSGGQTPLPFYRRLAAAELDWTRVNFALVDERWVGVDTESSNEKQLRECLAGAISAGAAFVGMKNEADTPQAGWTICERRYQALGRAFDLVLLGMGEDGHTASLFPNADGLARALSVESVDICAAINAQRSAVTGDCTARMSLSLASLASAAEIHLLLTGQAKLDVFQQAVDGSDWLAMPIRAVLASAAAPVRVWWAA